MKCMFVLAAVLAVVVAEHQLTRRQTLPIRGSRPRANAPAPRQRQTAPPSNRARQNIIQVTTARPQRLQSTPPPTLAPTFQPAYQTTYQPTYQPTFQPTFQPSFQPSFQPFVETAAPSEEYEPQPAPVEIPSPPAPTFSRLPSPTQRRTTTTAAPFIPYRVNSDDANAQILSYDNEINPDGSFRYSYAADNGIAANAQGHLVNEYGNADVGSQVIEGSFSWTAPDGQQILTTYTADENGYRPQGDSIPTSPPIPDLIARALAYIEKKRLEQPAYEAAEFPALTLG